MFLQMECFQFSGNLEYFGVVCNFDLFMVLYKCLTPLSLDPKWRIPKTCLWQVKHHLIECINVLIYLMISSS